jgi:hypothetical protein
MLRRCEALPDLPDRITPVKNAASAVIDWS